MSTGFKTDPVQLEILVQRFRSVAEEMAYALKRTGHTAFVNETGDLGVALISRNGEIFGFPKAIGITMFVSLNYVTVLNAVDDLKQGDIVVFNDPYTTGGVGSHLPDINIFKPIFHGGELICYAYAYVHATDIGGKVAGSLSPSSYEVYQEGLRIPPMKLYRAGQPNQDFLDLFFANCRIPEDNWGDIGAMVTAVNLGEQRVGELVGRYGRDELWQAIDDALDYSEARSRAVIEKIPDGRYRFSDYLEDDVVTGIPIKICVEVIIEGGSMLLDFAGTDVQVRAAFNLYSEGRPHPWMVYKIMFLLLTMDHEIPLNAGLMRPVEVAVPDGSILNCKFPAAIGLRTTLGVRVQDALMGAMARALPEVVPAAGAGYVAPIVFAEPNLVSGGLKVTVIEPMVGGTGATSDSDGVNARDVVDLSNLRNNPTEIVETIAAVKIRRYGLREDSAGAGKYRGGCGKILEFEILSPDCLTTARGMERHRFAPWGLKGGFCGAKAKVLLRPSGAEEFEDIGKIDSLKLSAGDVLQVHTPGGAGYGDPLERDVARIEKDLAGGIISAAAAELDYGIVLNGAGIDRKATEKRRAQLAAGKKDEIDLHRLGPDREEYERLWSDDLWDRFTEILYALPVPFRADVREQLWHRVDQAARNGQQVTPGMLGGYWEDIKVRYNDALGQAARGGE
ncbi:MAG: hydantoinase B/oxoprolinase family protein [Rhodospirillales bacterium]|jgi:N-methylhydantoinase B|nr:hypothetical protein [Rhodospirillaceae bacterium]MDP6429159.1 hydantoinase B/oxoprolinase family protein [Rhodospirillales bacterium]MDP6643343.1 hydantoinase B/oxoprolinase family protein [Rhodospirillales bacterium]